MTYSTTSAVQLDLERPRLKPVHDAVAPVQLPQDFRHAACGINRRATFNVVFTPAASFRRDTFEVFMHSDGKNLPVDEIAADTEALGEDRTLAEKASFLARVFTDAARSLNVRLVEEDNPDAPNGKSHQWEIDGGNDHDVVWGIKGVEFLRRMIAYNTGTAARKALDLPLDKHRRAFQVYQT